MTHRPDGHVDRPLVTLVLIVVVVVGAIGAEIYQRKASPPSSPAGPVAPTVLPKNEASGSVSSPPVDQLVESVSDSPLGPLFLGYKIEDGSAHMQLNPRAWNPLKRSDKREIMDIMAAHKAWKEAGLINAWFYVGASQIGRVANGTFKPGSAWADQ